MFYGKMKAVTFSYDDGVTQDQRLIALLNRYGMKATFNLNSGLLGQAGALVRENLTVAHVRPRAQEIRALYAGHEIAGHTLTHPLLPKLDEDAIVHEVEEDRLRLSELMGYEVVGMAYPGGGVNQDERVREILRRRTGVRYARTILSSYGFAPQNDLLCFRPSVYHLEWEELERLTEQFVMLRPQTPAVFSIWGHAYELDLNGQWERFERVLKRLSGCKDAFFGTNREVLLDMPQPEAPLVYGDPDRN